MRLIPSLFRRTLGAEFPSSREHSIRLTWFVWAGYFLAVCVVFFLKETGRPVNYAYACGAQRWVKGRDLYGGEGGFIYPPQSAVVYVPFYLLGGPGEQVLWRLVTIGLFAAGVFQLARLAGRGTQVEFFSLVTLLVLPKNLDVRVQRAGDARDGGTVDVGSRRG